MHGGDGDATGHERALDRHDFVGGHDEVAHEHGVARRPIEADPRTEREPRRDGDIADRDLQVTAW